MIAFTSSPAIDRSSCHHRWQLLLLLTSSASPSSSTTSVGLNCNQCCLWRLQLESLLLLLLHAKVFCHICFKSSMDLSQIICHVNFNYLLLILSYLSNNIDLLFGGIIWSVSSYVSCFYSVIYLVLSNYYLFTCALLIKNKDSHDTVWMKCFMCFLVFLLLSLKISKIFTFT